MLGLILEGAQLSMNLYVQGIFGLILRLTFLFSGHLVWFLGWPFFAVDIWFDFRLIWWCAERRGRGVPGSCLALTERPHKYIISSRPQPQLLQCGQIHFKFETNMFQNVIMNKDTRDKRYSKQDHRRWRYHRRLLDYQSPYFQLNFPLDHQRLGDHWVPLDH